MRLLGKLLLYNLSLAPLYLMIIIQNLELPRLEYICRYFNTFNFYKTILLTNLFFLLLLILIVISIFTYKQLLRETKNSNGLPKKFTKIQSLEFQHLTFISTYILPLLALHLDTFRDVFFFIILLAFIGGIYIKSNLYYLNPVFILFGLKVYSAVDNEKQIKILITKESLNDTEELFLKEVGNIYFAKKIEKVKRMNK